MTPDELILRSVDDKVALLVRAQPGARRNEIKGIFDGKLKVAVTTAPEKGKANRAIREFLAKVLGVRTQQLEIVRGHTSSDKTVLVHGLSARELRARLQTQ